MNPVEYCCIEKFASRANGCKNSVFTWRSGQRDLYAATGRICGSRQGTHGVQAHQELVWTKASTKAVSGTRSLTPSGSRVDSAKLKRILVVTSRNTLIHISFYS